MRHLSLQPLALALLLVSSAAWAAPHTSDPEVTRRAHRIAQDLMSPFCPGRTLADCPSPDALAVREQIRALLAEGAPEAEIRERLGATYGDAIIGVPRGAVGWLVPVLLLLLGAVLPVAVLRRRSGPASPLPPDPAGLAADLDREIESRGL